jgi:hypothetical protein
VALILKRLPKAPPGRRALECPRCNAIQNLRDEDETLTCWASKYREPVDELLTR